MRRLGLALLFAGCGSAAVGEPDCHQLGEVREGVGSCPYAAGRSCPDARWPVRCGQLDEALARRLDASTTVLLGRDYARALSRGPAGAYCPTLGPDAPPNVARTRAWYAVGGADLVDGAFGAWVAPRVFPCLGYERALDGGGAREDVVVGLPYLVGARQLCCAVGPPE